MAQIKKTVDPFGEVNIYPGSDGKMRVTATILMEPRTEGTKTGIALDGSYSMEKLYGGVEETGGFFASLFGTKKKKIIENEITPVAQRVCAYLARKLDADGGTTCIYWATGLGGSEIEVIGDLTGDQAEQHIFGRPQNFGTGTQLLPAVRYFVERFKDAPWGFYVFITDGELFDLEEVEQYSTRLAQDIAEHRRHPVKFVLIGLGSDVNELQLEELDDLDTGTGIDLWDHKLASELRVLQQIFAEVVDRNARVADNGRILDSLGRVLKNYSDTGLPAYLEFEVPLESDYFTLEVNGNRIHQPLYDQAQVPSSQLTPAPAPTPRLPAPTPPPVQPPAPAEEPGVAEILPEEKELIDDAAKVTASKDDDDLWKKIDLRWSEDKKPGQ